MARKRDEMDQWLDERRAENRQRSAVLERAASLDIVAKARGGWGCTRTVTMTTDQLAAICDRLETQNS